MEILERSAVALGIILFGVALYWGWNRWRILRLNWRGSVLPGLEKHRPGVPAVLYFTTPDCVQCRTQQRPALETLLAQYREPIQVIEVNANESPRIADHWAVLSVPTTFIIDPLGRPRRVNNGVVSAEQLKQQLADIRNGHRS